MTRKRTPETKAAPREDSLFTLDVFIISGPMTERFVKKNRTISRTIAIRGDQTLAVLHEAIFDAFDREEEHMYEFQVGGKGPMDPNARKYGLSAPVGLFAEETNAGDVTKTVVGSLGLKVGDRFGYWFDFGDDWWHQINVKTISADPGKGKYPRVTKRVGESPPQYADLEEDS